MLRKRLSRTRTISPEAVAARDKVNARRKGTSIIDPAYRELLDQSNGLPAVNQNYSTLVQPFFVKHPDKRRVILEKIEEGNYISTVCRVIGIDRSTFNLWMKKGKAGVSQAYRDFYLEICKAEGNAESNLLTKISTQAADDWRAGAFILGKRWPDHWGKERDAGSININVKGDATIQIRDTLAEQIVNDPEAREFARRLLETADIGKVIDVESEDVHVDNNE